MPGTRVNIAVHRPHSSGFSVQHRVRTRRRLVRSVCKPLRLLHPLLHALANDSFTCKIGYQKSHQILMTFLKTKAEHLKAPLKQVFLPIDYTTYYYFNLT